LTGVLTARDAGGPALLQGDGFDEDAAERARDVGAEGGEVTEFEGDRRQDTIGEVGRGVRHAASSAARADAAALATERDEEIAAAFVPVESKEAVGEDTAREVVAESLLDVPRETARVFWRACSRKDSRWSRTRA